MKFTAAITLALASTAVGQSLVEVLNRTSSLSSLAALLSTPGLNLGNLTNVTLLAPNNDAVGNFTASVGAATLASNPALVQAVLTYHILQGNYSNITNSTFIPTQLMNQQFTQVTGGQRVHAVRTGSNITFFSGLYQNSSVVNASIPFSGGTIHIINRLLTLPQNVSTTAVALNLTSAAGAIAALNLSMAVNTTPNITLFLPNNAAFQRIGSGLANLTMANLTSILTYHAVANRVLYSTLAMNGTSVPTLNGANLTIHINNGSVYVNNARVVLPDVLVSNGVVHVIDRVLNPANPNIAVNASTTMDAFSGASMASNVPFTSGVPTPTSAIATNAATSALASARSSSSSAMAPRAMETGAMAVAALFGGAAAVLNL